MRECFLSNLFSNFLVYADANKSFCLVFAASSSSRCFFFKAWMSASRPEISTDSKPVK